MADRELVLVTGASGFVGKWTVVEALKAGFRVRGTVRSLDKEPAIRAAASEHAGQGANDRLELVTADLLDDAGWDVAMAGVGAVLHTAAVIRGDEPRDQTLVVRPAVEGTKRILEFADKAGVRRVIITSSIATVGYGHGQNHGKRVYDETYFTNLEGMRWTWAYCIGKTKAEQLAWEFARTHDLALTTIHPGAIIGPALDSDASISIGLVTSLLDGTVPALPRTGFSIIDVRDVAALHIVALQRPETAGQRYLATAEYTPFPKVADILREAYPDRQITRRFVPDWIIRLFARFGGPTRQIINDIGNEKHFDGSKAEALLGRKFIPVRQSILDTAESAIRLGLLQGPGGKLKIS